MDEIDGLLPAAGNYKYVMAQHQQQIVDQALTLMSQLDPHHQVFLVGIINHIEDIDERVLRGGRFSEKIELGVPDDGGYLRLIEKHLGRTPLADGFTAKDLLNTLRGISPADLEAVMNTAKRMAFSRRADKKVKQLPMLIAEDFDKAIERTRIRFSDGRR